MFEKTFPSSPTDLYLSFSLGKKSRAKIIRYTLFKRNTVSHTNSVKAKTKWQSSDNLSHRDGIFFGIYKSKHNDKTKQIYTYKYIFSLW